MTARDLRNALEHDLQQIEDNIVLYKRGRDSAYQAVAIQLRNLLLKGPRGLAARVFPRLTLYQLTPVEDADQPGDSDGRHVQMLRRVTLSLQTSYPGAQARLQLAEDLPKLSVEEWLEQWLISPKLSIRQLIRQVANEEVAHTEDEVGKEIGGTLVWQFGGVGRDRQLYQLLIVAIGGYVASELRKHMGTPSR
jgi:hypothetical protein